jgi:hypothetical protein
MCRFYFEIKQFKGLNCKLYRRQSPHRLLRTLPIHRTEAVRLCRRDTGACAPADEAPFSPELYPLSAQPSHAVAALPSHPAPQL